MPIGEIRRSGRLKGAISTDSVSTEEELLCSIALQSAKMNLEHALTALAYDPARVSVVFETDQMSFDWRQKGNSAAFASPGKKLSIKAYLRAEASAPHAVPKEEHPSAQKFDVKA